MWKSTFMLLFCCLSSGGAGGKGVWGAAGMVYEDEEPDVRDPNYDESAQVSVCVWLNVHIHLNVSGLGHRKRAGVGQFTLSVLID